MSFLDDLVKLQFMTPMYNVIGKTIGTAHQQKLMDQSIPYIQQMIDNINNLSQGNELDPNKIQSIALKTYGDLLKLTRGESAKANEAIKSIWESVLTNIKTGAESKQASAMANFYNQSAAEKGEERKILAETGRAEVQSKIDLSKAQAKYYNNLLEKKSDEDKEKLVFGLKLQFLTNVGNDEDLVRALSGINLDNYINEKKIDFDGLARVAAENANPNWQNMTESMREAEIFNYRNRISKTLLSDVIEARRVNDIKVLQDLIKQKNAWDSNSLNVRENEETGEMERIPFPYNEEISILMKNLYGNEFTSTTGTNDPILERAKEIMDEHNKNTNNHNKNTNNVINGSSIKDMLELDKDNEENLLKLIQSKLDTMKSK